jgi:hypothetical protein
MRRTETECAANKYRVGFKQDLETPCRYPAPVVGGAKGFCYTSKKFGLKNSIRVDDGKCH